MYGREKEILCANNFMDVKNASRGKEEIFEGGRGMGSLKYFLKKV